MDNDKIINTLCRIQNTTLNAVFVISVQSKGKYHLLLNACIASLKFLSKYKWHRKAALHVLVLLVLDDIAAQTRCKVISFITGSELIDIMLAVESEYSIS